MEILLSILISAIAVFVTAYILPGIALSGFGTAIVLAIVLAVINSFIKPVLIILTLPINILTLGLFTFVIMALLVMLASAIVPGFYVASFWWALLFAIVLAVVNSVLGGFKMV
ncbi:MAG: phage holin family protein [Parachlamydiales bacterium]